VPHFVKKNCVIVIAKLSTDFAGISFVFAFILEFADLVTEKY
jgi:hypothetical protein